ncbi:hypothetical protein XELAEV_18039406mg [Xenopus laevis]|uniref:Uncharacterized protein n=1 Tax=Xenopus laevis TaxID=8355 RepID=A0A974C7J0_XENLA|nr:hypothetical protein XELAEV_18039406mg [Xenopus laevis]
MLSVVLKSLRWQRPGKTRMAAYVRAIILHLFASVGMQPRRSVSKGTHYGHTRAARSHALTLAVFGQTYDVTLFTVGHKTCSH